MKKKIVLKRIFHRDRWRLALVFDFDNSLLEKVRALPGCAFSSTNKCFYVDDTEENFRMILSSLKDHAEIDISAVAWKESRDDRQVKELIEPVKKEEEKIISGPVSEDESIPEDDWSEYSGSEVTSGKASTFQGNRYGTNKGSYGPVEFRIEEKEGLLIIRFLGKYDTDWIREMRSYGELRFDKKRLEWKLRWKKLTCDSLADYFAGQGVKVNINRPLVPGDLAEKRKATGEEIRSRSLSGSAMDGLAMLEWFLDDNRYSKRTKESYMAMLEFFFRYFSPKEPGNISEEEISKFLYDFIIKLGYSAAYQNQMVSAIKTFYSISGTGEVRPDLLARPRRSRALPKVFSKEEVGLILNSLGNVKHKLILWIIYSCGLRRSEVTNIRMTDLDRDRSILHIREGKGMVDRIVPMSDKVWQKVDEYLAAYRPLVYLFEGQSGGRYSSESVYRIFREALVKSGIKKEVGVHSLRHSYATHLHENGLDIRYIQELLGHRSTRTTEIYTHVSRRNLVAVRSPIEDLDLK